MWGNHVAECVAVDKDPLLCKCIPHVDAYPVHISSEFREWMAKEYPQLLLLHVCYADCRCRIQ